MYKLVVKCMNCEAVIRTKELSEESFFAMGDRINARNDRYGDDCGHVGTDTITSYNGLCEDCKAEEDW